MREPVSQPGMRVRRASIALNATDAASPHEKRNAPGERGLRVEAQVNAWRRTEMGTNQIACFGIWRRGARRQAQRMNRANSTRWHKLHRRLAVFTLAGAQNNEAAIEA